MGIVRKDYWGDAIQFLFTTSSMGAVASNFGLRRNAVCRAGSTTISSSCHCGSIGYEANIHPRRVTVCHCKGCRQRTGSAFRVLVGATGDHFTLLRGTPAIYVKIGDSGAKRAQAFCQKCGSPIYTYDIDHPVKMRLRVGCIDLCEELRSTKQIWCQSALSRSMNIQDVPRIARE